MLDTNRSYFFPPHSLYVSLKEPSLRRELIDEWLSEKHDRYIYFIVERQQHYSLVQTHIHPFQLHQYPEQWFYSVIAHYTLCCSDAKADDFHKTLYATAQKIYTRSFKFQNWNFSSPHCWYVLHNMNKGLQLTRKRKFEGDGSHSSKATTCLTATVESFQQCLPDDIHRSNSDIQIEHTRTIGKKRIGETLERCYEMLKRPCVSHLEQRTFIDNDCRPLPLTRDSLATLYSNSAGVITLAEQLGEVERIAANLLTLESYATQISNLSKYLSTSILRLHTEELKLGSRQRQTKASVPCHSFSRPNFNQVHKTDERERPLFLSTRS
jgi:hypothetical protein